MATLALSLAGQFVGGLVGGPFGAMAGRALGALAGSAVDGMLFGAPETPSVGGDIRLQGSSEGGAAPRLYGWSRLSGNIIWARELELLGGEGGGAKGTGGGEEELGVSFAVAFCEGEVQRLGRIWADGQLLETEGLTLRFYRGTETQLPDGLIEATQGEAPAYRGLCYLVVEQLPLSRFGNRIPQLSVELCRVVGDLEPQIRAVTIIPGAAEFGYDPTPRVRVLGPGRSSGENNHGAAALSDWTLSLDELQALCPNLSHVALVVAWFGNDLRCGSCLIGPRVEAANRDVQGVTWSVMGLGRGAVPVVSSHDGGPAYGGTPSDASVKAAIADLKARGIGVTLYPIIMMDVPQGNALPDPYGGAAQAAYPWRGRITCHPAAGQPGSPDATGVAATQVASFVTRYRQMVLHYAGLCAAAGGVDAFLIGSELRGLTTVRGAANSFPFVDALVTLAADVRAVVGAGTKLTYAADWSEYSGYQPAGQKFFHLDPLWASPNINAVGIDNYLPLADWRDGTGHLDAALSENGYDLDYLTGNIAGGEGYDWYYASDAARLAQTRTPITDGTYGEPWVWRSKDIRNWWSQWHYDRPGGVRKATPTAWVPGSKPIWLTELGCGAVDKGANQPNIFGDAKSAEGGRPYFSAGTPDALIQRQFLRAHHRYWRDPANNPVGMLDVSRVYLWTWDARPYPAFPALTEVWADGENHRCGHWLTGRLGSLASDELAEVVAAEHGVVLDAEPAAPLLQGYMLAQASTGRDALEPVIAASGMRLRNTAEGLVLRPPARDGAVVLDTAKLVAEDGPVLAKRRPDPAEAPGRLTLRYLDRERDYLSGAVTALHPGVGPLASESTALVLDGSAARLVAERLLDARNGGAETLDFALKPTELALQPGDLVRLGDGAPVEIVQICDGLSRKVTAKPLPSPLAIGIDADRGLLAPPAVAVQALPVVLVAHLPPLPETPDRSRLVVAGFAQPWPGALRVVDDNSGATVLDLPRRAAIGTTVSILVAGTLGIWDRAHTLDVELAFGHLADAETLALLAGANRLAVQTNAGQWEVLGFAEATLLAPGRYRLSRLLRGLEGTGPAMGLVSAGRPVIVLDGRSGTLELPTPTLGETRNWRVYGGSSDLAGTPLSVGTTLAPVRPLPPVHLRARRVGGDIRFTWTRASRADGDDWGLVEPALEHAPEAYQIGIYNGSTPKRGMDVSAPTALYTAAQQTADWGGPATSFIYGVVQISPVLGAGYGVSASFP